LRSFETGKDLTQTWEKYFKENFKIKKTRDIKQTCLEQPINSEILFNSEWHPRKYISVVTNEFIQNKRNKKVDDDKDLERSGNSRNPSVVEISS
jgi:hypothetical protein